MRFSAWRRPHEGLPQTPAIGCSIRIIPCRSWSACDLNVYPVPGVVSVALKIPDLLDVLWLCAGGRIRGPDSDLMHARAEIQAGLPETPGRGMVSAFLKIRLDPSHSPVGGHLHPLHASIAAHYSVSSNRHGPFREGLAFRWIANDGVQRCLTQHLSFGEIDCLHGYVWREELILAGL